MGDVESLSVGVPFRDLPRSAMLGGVSHTAMRPLPLIGAGALACGVWAGVSACCPRVVGVLNNVEERA
jgi:hypothetical protein